MKSRVATLLAVPLLALALLAAGPGTAGARITVSCNAVMAQIAYQMVLLINDNPRPDASLTATQYNVPSVNTTLNLPVACLTGVNQAYGAVAVMNYAGLVASDYGYSANYITC
jgi:hypothetical protein